MSAEVKVGQIWADNDWRMEGRTVRVDRISVATHGTRLYAICTVLSDRKTAVKSQVGRQAQIRLDRFRPTSTGYRLLRDPT